MHKKKKVVYGLLLVAFLCLLTGCGSKSENIKGRYVEKNIVIGNGEHYYPKAIFYTADTIRIACDGGIDLISEDQGISFQSAHQVPIKFTKEIRNNINSIGMYSSTKGDRFIENYNEDGSYSFKLLSTDGKTISLSDLPTDTGLCVLNGNENFFYVISGLQVFDVAIDTGKVEYLFDMDDYCQGGAVIGNQLYLYGVSGVEIFDLTTKARVRDDNKLNAFLKSDMSAYNMQTPSFILLEKPDQSGIYIITQAGIFSHTPYKTDFSEVLRGSLYTIGDVRNTFISAITIPENDTVNFEILFTDGTLKRYVFDETLSSVPEQEVRIYSLYEDGNIKQAITTYQTKNPNVYCDYEIGITDENSMTAEDALKNLSTEIATGNGPDIMVLDNLPYTSYINKGLLLDLGDILKEAEEKDTFFDNIINDLAVDNTIYTIPITFSIPVIVGKKEDIDNLKDLSSLTSLLTEKRAENKSDSIFTGANARKLLKLMSQSSQGSWIDGQGKLDEENIRDFMTNCQKIYRVQNEGEDKTFQTATFSGIFPFGAGVNPLEKKFESKGAYDEMVRAYYLNQELFAGYLSGNFIEYVYLNSYLKNQDLAVSYLPGENEGTCLVSTLVSVNQGSKNLEQAKNFIEWMLSSEFQESAALNGAAINKVAFYGNEVNPDSGDSGPYSGIAISGKNNETLQWDVYWPEQKQIDAFNELVDQVNGVNQCEQIVFDAIINKSEQVLDDNLDIDTAIQELKKEMKLYLAEE